MRVNRAQLASIMGWSLPTVDARVREGMPYVSKPGAGNKKGGTWEFESGDCILWLVKKSSEPLAKNPQAEVSLRTAVAEATLKEIQVMEKQKLLIPIADVVKVVGENIAVLKSRVTALAGRLAQAVAGETDPAAVLRIIKAEVAEVLDEISSFYLDTAKVSIEPGSPPVPIEEPGPPRAAVEEDPFDGY